MVEVCPPLPNGPREQSIMEKSKPDPIVLKTKKSAISRRNFVRCAATIGAVTATVPLESLLGGQGSVVKASTIDYQPNKRTNDSFIYRRNTAIANKVNIGEVPVNGDRAAFTDFSGVYSKALLHDGL